MEGFGVGGGGRGRKGLKKGPGRPKDEIDEHAGHAPLGVQASGPFRIRDQ
jgi:hypothetical protein